MARSWATLVLEPVDVWCYESSYTAALGQVVAQAHGQVLARVTLRIGYAMSRGACIVVPTVFQAGQFAAFLPEARQLLRREREEVWLNPECGMHVLCRWLDPDPDAVERARSEGWLKKTFSELVLRVCCRYEDIPQGGEDTRRPWWMDWAFAHSAFAEAPYQVRVAVDDLLATRAQFEGLIEAVEAMVAESGGRRI